MNVIAGLALLIVWMSAAYSGFSQSTQIEKRQFNSVRAQAEKGDAQAQYNLGALYAAGAGTKRDAAKAAKWYRQAAEQGFAPAQVRVAFAYMNGIGVKPDPAESVQWLRRAAEQNSREAQFQLGRCYAEGEGISESPVEAAKSYRKAAEQDYAPAQYALGNCYFDGYGVTKDVPEGVVWTRKAAEQGYAPAENRFGLCYAKGTGVPQNYLEAYKWFNLSAAQGDEHDAEARINLSMAERAMTPEQIAQGQKLAREFKPRLASAHGSPASAQENPRVTADSPGQVNISADDQSCEIFLDGAFVGNAPAKLQLQPGMHAIEVKKPQFKTYHKELKVTPGSELSLRAVLEKQ